MNIGKEKVSKSFLEKVRLSKGDGGFYSMFKNHYFEEKLNLGGYGYVDIFFYKKDYIQSEIENEEVVNVKIVTICSSFIGFDEILKSSRIKRGVFKYIRDIIGVDKDKPIYYNNYLVCPGFKEDGFEMISDDIEDLEVYQYSFDVDGFNLYNAKDRLRVMVPSNRVLRVIKKRLL